MDFINETLEKTYKNKANTCDFSDIFLLENGFASKSASPSEILELIFKNKYKKHYISKIFPIIDRTAYHGLMYEKLVYSTIIKDIQDNHLSRNFIRYYASGTCTYDKLKSLAGDDPEVADRLKRNLIYLQYNIPSKPSIMDDKVKLKSLGEAKKLDPVLSYGYIITKKSNQIRLFDYLTSPISDFKYIWQYLFQIFYSLNILNNKYKCNHNDLHSANILMDALAPGEMYYCIYDDYIVNTPYVPRIFDFDRAYIEGKNNPQNTPFMCDLQGQCNFFSEYRDLLKVSCYFTHYAPMTEKLIKIFCLPGKEQALRKVYNYKQNNPLDNSKCFFKSFDSYSEFSNPEYYKNFKPVNEIIKSVAKEAGIEFTKQRGLEFLDYCYRVNASSENIKNNIYGKTTIDFTKILLDAKPMTFPLVTVPDPVAVVPAPVPASVKITPQVKKGPIIKQHLKISEIADKLIEIIKGFNIKNFNIISDRIRKRIIEIYEDNLKVTAVQITDMLYGYYEDTLLNPMIAQLTPALESMIPVIEMVNIPDKDKEEVDKFIIEEITRAGYKIVKKGDILYQIFGDLYINTFNKLLAAINYDIETSVIGQYKEIPSIRAKILEYTNKTQKMPIDKIAHYIILITQNYGEFYPSTARDAIENFYEKNSIVTINDIIIILNKYIKTTIDSPMIQKIKHAMQYMIPIKSTTPKNSSMNKSKQLLKIPELVNKLMEIIKGFNIKDFNIHSDKVRSRLIDLYEENLKVSAVEITDILDEYYELTLLKPMITQLTPALESMIPVIEMVMIPFEELSKVDKFIIEEINRAGYKIVPKGDNIHKIFEKLSLIRSFNKLLAAINYDIETSVIGQYKEIPSIKAKLLEYTNKPQKMSPDIIAQNILLITEEYTDIYNPSIAKDEIAALYNQNSPVTIKEVLKILNNYIKTPNNYPMVEKIKHAMQYMIPKKSACPVATSVAAVPVKKTSNVEVIKNPSNVAVIELPFYNITECIEPKNKSNPNGITKDKLLKIADKVKIPYNKTDSKKSICKKLIDSGLVKFKTKQN